MNAKILLIEQDADVRDMITYVLEDEGISVISFSRTDDLEGIVALQPDLVLIDEWLSGMPGHRLCLRIKRYEKISGVPVIILSTANHIEQIMSECRADGFIRKPFDLEELLSKVRQQLISVGK